MGLNRRNLFQGLALLVTLITFSCSKPGDDLVSDDSSKPATAEVSNKSDVAAVSAEPKKPATEETKKKRVQQTPRALIPRPQVPPASDVAVASPPVTPPQAVTSAPATRSIVLPALQVDPIPAPIPPPKPTAKQVTIPAGTEVYIRMIDSIDTERSHPNQTFRASLDKPIVMDNQTIIPRRSDVFVKVIEVQSAGKLSGTSELKVQLDRLFIGKQSYPVVSNDYTQTGSSEGKKAARNVGLGAAVGGVLGGILGGTKGAVIGAGAGGGGGAVISKGEQIQIASETQMLFKLENPLDVTVEPPPATRVASATNNANSDGPMKLAPPAERSSSRDSSQTSSSNNNDLTGSWTVTTNGSQNLTLQLSLRQDGSNLQGTISNPRGSGTLPIRGSLNGNYVNFSTQSQYGSNGMQIQFSGAIQNDGMQGTATMPSNSSSGNSGGYPGGGFPGTGYPSGGRSRGRNGAGGATNQLQWSAQRND